VRSGPQQRSGRSSSSPWKPKSDDAWRAPGVLVPGPGVGGPATQALTVVERAGSAHRCPGVSAAGGRDRPGVQQPGPQRTPAILAFSGESFVWLAPGPAAFSAVLQLSLRCSQCAHGPESSVVLLLAYYTLQELDGSLRGGAGGPGRGRAAPRGPLGVGPRQPQAPQADRRKRKPGAGLEGRKGGLSPPSRGAGRLPAAGSEAPIVVSRRTGNLRRPTQRVRRNVILLAPHAKVPTVRLAGPASRADEVSACAGQIPEILRKKAACPRKRSRRYAHERAVRTGVPASASGRRRPGAGDTKGRRVSASGVHSRHRERPLQLGGRRDVDNPQCSSPLRRLP
jgi:hypothetical protein